MPRREVLGGVGLVGSCGELDMLGLVVLKGETCANAVRVLAVIVHDVPDLAEQGSV
jgi:hypothetical protein